MYILVVRFITPRKSRTGLSSLTAEATHPESSRLTASHHNQCTVVNSVGSGGHNSVCGNSLGCLPTNRMNLVNQTTNHIRMNETTLTLLSCFSTSLLPPKDWFFMQLTSISSLGWIQFLNIFLLFIRAWIIFMSAAFIRLQNLFPIFGSGETIRRCWSHNDDYNYHRMIEFIRIIIKSEDRKYKFTTYQIDWKE